MPDQPLAPGELPAPGVEGIVVGLGGGLEGVECRPGRPAVDRHEPSGDFDVARQLRIKEALAPAAPEQLRPVAVGPVGPDEVLLRACLRFEHPHDHEHNLSLRAQGRLDPVPREELFTRAPRAAVPRGSAGRIVWSRSGGPAAPPPPHLWYGESAARTPASA